MLLLKGHRRRIRGLAFAPDGKLLASAGGKGTAVWLWDTARGKRAAYLSSDEPRARIVHLASSAVQPRLASIGNDGLMHLWNFDTQRAEGLPVRLGSWGAARMAFSHDAKTLAVLGSLAVQYAASLWTVGSKRTKAELRSPPPGLAAACLAFSPDDRTLAIGSVGEIHFWDVTGRFRERVRTGGRVYALAYVPDQRLLVGGVGKSVVIWETEKWKEIAVLKGHRTMVTSLALSPDGCSLLSASTDATVRLWDIANRRLIATYDWEIGRVFEVAIAPDGMRAAAGGEADIMVWDLDV